MFAPGLPQVTLSLLGREAGKGRIQAQLAQSIQGVLVVQLHRLFPVKVSRFRAGGLSRSRGGSCTPGGTGACRPGVPFLWTQKRGRQACPTGQPWFHRFPRRCPCGTFFPARTWRRRWAASRAPPLRGRVPRPVPHPAPPPAHGGRGTPKRRRRTDSCRAGWPACTSRRLPGSPAPRRNPMAYILPTRY